MKTTKHLHSIIIVVLLVFCNTLFAQKAYEKPIFKSCVNTPTKKLDACFEEKLQEHISANLIYPAAARGNKIEETIKVEYEIDKDGSISKIKTGLFGDLYLRAEAERIISLLPTFIYSEENKHPKTQTFSVDIIFKITRAEKENPNLLPITERYSPDSSNTDEQFTFAIVEEKPIFKGCEGTNGSERELCFQQKIAEHIGGEFKYPEIAKKYGIQGRVFVQFVVDRDGSVMDISTVRGVHALLDMEAERMVQSIPKMTPAFQRGKPVKMVFTVPIVFRLQ